MLQNGCMSQLTTTSWACDTRKPTANTNRNQSKEKILEWHVQNKQHVNRPVEKHHASSTYELDLKLLPDHANTQLTQLTEYAQTCNQGSP